MFLWEMLVIKNINTINHYVSMVIGFKMRTIFLCYDSTLVVCNLRRGISMAGIAYGYNVKSEFGYALKIECALLHDGDRHIQWLLHVFYVIILGNLELLDKTSQLIKVLPVFHALMARCFSSRPTVYEWRKSVTDTESDDIISLMLSGWISLQRLASLALL